MITLTPELLQAVDAAARGRSQKRSRVIRQALEEWLERQRQQEFEELLAEGYREQAAVLAELVNDVQLAQAMALENAGPWDG
jgi:metal-responsive CopG/Arc/MetJ family transcriptional regulator